ncbi:2-oxo acid dehydrogenase subunit E2 [Halobaculum sp. EA56]|uniref:2-oxo acid dehydrogenase subunit E2 n=1 Tax=Halobaculum sp. EA56 TaxID=3421648 RepID=UPI003EBBC809
MTDDTAADDAGDTADEDDESGGGPRSEPAPRTVAEERTPSPMRRTIAKRLHESYSEAVHVTATRVVDAEDILAAVDAADERVDASVSVTDLLIAALSEALAEHPAFNATFEDGTHRIYEEHNVGYGVDLDAGLVAPVIPDVRGRTVGEIADRRSALVGRVRAGDYDAADLRGGTFTVSNLGPLGVDSFTPVINPPEVAILGVNRIRERAVREARGDAADAGGSAGADRGADDQPGTDGVAFRRQLPLDLSFDHRVVDGADAARFLDTLADRIEVAGTLVDE